MLKLHICHFPVTRFIYTDTELIGVRNIMSRHKHGVFGYIIRTIGVLLTVSVLAGTCMVPSKVRAQKDLTVDFIEYAFHTLLGKDPEGEQYGFWYRNIKDGNTTAAGMIEMLSESEEFSKKNYSADQELTLLTKVMTGKELASAEKERYLSYMESGVSLRRFISDVSKTPDFAAVCAQYKITPGTVDDLESRDHNPELTIFIGQLFTEMYGRSPSAKEANVWTQFFREGKAVAPTLQQIIVSSDYTSRGVSDDQTITSLCHLMLDRDATAEEMGKYHEVMENGVSIDYVAQMIASDPSFASRCADLDIVPGEINLTQARDLNYEMTSFLNRLYSRLSGKAPTGEELNDYVWRTSEYPSSIRSVIWDILSTPESREILASDDDFLNTVFEVFYGHEPEQEKITSYKIALSHGITRERVLSSILDDPAFDAKMGEYGLDTHVEKEVPKKIVALTFDDGPYTDVTMRILDTLEPYGAHATFFVTGDRVNRYKDCIIRATNMGCEVGNHTWNHTTLTKISGDAVHKQIWDTCDAIYALTGSYPKVMRPVGGSYNATVSENVGLPMILWSIDTNDWKYRDSQHVINEVLNNVRDGDIILMHDLYETTATAVETIVPALIDSGYTLVTISELAEYKKVQMENGKPYFSMRG